VRAWSSLAYLFPGLHPEGFESPDSGWPPGLKRFAREAWRRARAKELADERLCACDAQWSGLFDSMLVHRPEETERRVELAAEFGRWSRARIQRTQSGFRLLTTAPALTRPYATLSHPMGVVRSRRRWRVFAFFAFFGGEQKPCSSAFIRGCLRVCPLNPQSPTFRPACRLQQSAAFRGDVPHPVARQPGGGRGIGGLQPADRPGILGA
jgi:hypothetical protein